MTFDVDSTVALRDGFAHLVQQLGEGRLQVGTARAERTLFGQANDHARAVAFHLGFAGLNFFGQGLADALQFGVRIGRATGTAAVAFAAGTARAVVAHFNRRLG